MLNIFEGCTGLTSVILPESVRSINFRAFYGCSNLKSIKMPSHLETIGQNAFTRCVKLNDVQIPNSVTAISHGAFNGCLALTSFDIPESVTSLGDYFIDGCSAMTDLYVHHTTPILIEENTFIENTQQQVTLHVPSGSKEKYSSTPYWKGFSKIIDDIEDSGISSATTDKENVRIYDLRGHRCDRPQRGINIIRRSDGTTRKEIVR